MDYDELLKKAQKELPKDVFESERFKIPNIKGHIEGNKTVLANFFQIGDVLGTDKDHFLKYMLKELATPGDTKGRRVVLGRKVSASRINEKIKEYATKYVICKECGKPDSKITKQNRILFFKCNACGARYPVS